MLVEIALIFPRYPANQKDKGVRTMWVEINIYHHNEYIY